MLQFFTIVTGKLPYAKGGMGGVPPSPYTCRAVRCPTPMLRKERERGGGGGAIHPNKC